MKYSFKYVHYSRKQHFIFHIQTPFWPMYTAPGGLVTPQRWPTWKDNFTSYRHKNTPSHWFCMMNTHRLCADKNKMKWRIKIGGLNGQSISMTSSDICGGLVTEQGIVAWMNWILLLEIQNFFNISISGAIITTNFVQWEDTGSAACSHFFPWLTQYI